MQIGLEIVTDRSRIDSSLVHSLLADTYWANNRTLEQTELSISSSTPFAVFAGPLLVGFARVISDRLTLAYLLDMYVIPERRGTGIGTLLLQTMLDHTYFESVQRWMLRTMDAKSLYSRFGFELVADDDTLMVLDRAVKSNLG
ncbi:MAG: GNAT family N-acetyltransferase [Planctomycetota bacterium]